jgi:hypothetical protein
VEGDNKKLFAIDGHYNKALVNKMGIMSTILNLHTQQSTMPSCTPSYLIAIMIKNNKMK